MLRFHDSLAPNLRIAGVHLKAARELLRHANSLKSLRYTRAISSTNREANCRARQMFLDVEKRGSQHPRRHSRRDRRLRTIRSFLKSLVDLTLEFSY